MAYLIAAPFIAVLYLLFGTKTGRKAIFYTWIGTWLLFVQVILVLVFYGIFFPAHLDYLANADFGEGFTEMMINRTLHWFPWQTPDEWVRIGNA